MTDDSKHPLTPNDDARRAAKQWAGWTYLSAFAMALPLIIGIVFVLVVLIVFLLAWVLA